MLLFRFFMLLMCVITFQSLANQNKGTFLSELSWIEAKQRLNDSPIVVIPFAAGAKEHGPHLPMNADRTVMDHLVKHAVKFQDVIVTPPVLHGWFPAFRDFPGTEISDPDLFRRYIQQIAESVIRQGAKRIVFLNMGIMKATGLPIAIAAREIRSETGVPTLLVNWEDLETEDVAAIFDQLKDGHGDEVETSIALYLQPDRVNMHLATKDYREHLKKTYSGYRPGLFSLDPNDPNYSASGHSGDPTLATAEKGEKILAIMSAQWLEILNGFANSPVRKSAR